mmetsp:Transcript_135002/g.252416  ORF Transcript_135002/g.252416 Transcript_135002/m.252416 type:complete len:98 (+) Transcript_135002:1070-1363(+)
MTTSMATKQFRQSERMLRMEEANFSAVVLAAPRNRSRKMARREHLPSSSSVSSKKKCCKRLLWLPVIFINSGWRSKSVDYACETTQRKDVSPHGNRI